MFGTCMAGRATTDVPNWQEYMVMATPHAAGWEEPS
jgi:hypothetical protein